jgi:hypothetical protein
MLKIQNRIGIPESKKLGLDTLEECFDKDHYLSYTKNISYRYNSRGFRDHEWPEDLSDVVWCVGDSFTVGIGQPFEETWPQMLESKLGKRCINVGEDGCSNDTMSLRIQEICKSYTPKLIVVMWSHLQRRRVNDENVHHNKNDFSNSRDLKNFIKNYKLCANVQTDIIHSIIPDVFTEKNLKNIQYILQHEEIEDIISFPQLDYARDYHHFDIKTSELVTDLMIEKINIIDQSTSTYDV